MDEEDLPVVEIVEELDEEDNVVSSYTSTPASVKPQLLEVLRKAGVENIPELEDAAVTGTTKTEQVERPPDERPDQSIEEGGVASARKSKNKSKGVTFADDTKPGPEPAKSSTAKRIEEIMAMAKKSEAVSSEAAVIPTDEPEEDATLRRDMLQYGMSEIGAVVAELDLEEGSDWTEEEDEEDLSDFDEEDSHGRSTGRLVDDELRQQMIELEQRLGVRAMENIGKPADHFDASPLSDIVERATPAESAPVETPNLTKKPSRFKSSRASTSSVPESQQASIPNINFQPVQDTTRSVPSGPTGKVLADAVIERDVQVNFSVTEPDDLDPQLLHQEVATEYHKMRNKMIQREGGFMKEDESEIVPFTEEEGGPRKMSRFKAARLSKS